MASDGPKRPPWIHSKARPDAQLPRLNIYNSLTRSKEDFVPVDPTLKTVTWYACGPTAYEDATLGHAKNYVSTDIIRRIMKDYFGFHVKFVMNTTEIDDKIITRGHQQYLLARFRKNHAAKDDSVSDSVLNEARAAFGYYIGKNLPSLPSDTSPETFSREVGKAYKEMPETSPAHIETARSAAEILQAPGTLSGFLTKTEDVLLPYLDTLHGAEVDSNNHEIYLELIRKFEHRFFEGMKALNVLAPDQLTRATEYVPQIVRFVEKTVANGFGYATPDGSVYFDTDSFEKAGHSYSRLQPCIKNDRALQEDDEGSLSKEKSMKRSENHFELWKASKPGEPAWPSPWGRGRPGCLIGCSAMASEVLGSTIDIHSGGVHLHFPHHDNELAKSEAHWSTPGCPVQWTNHSIHIGQLRYKGWDADFVRTGALIDNRMRGLKMSKSLKNDATIRAVLSQNERSARSLRIGFLLLPWQDDVEVTDELMKTVVAWEGKLNNFFLESLDLWKHSRPETRRQELGIADQQLLSALEKAKADVHEALCDSFNTPAVMRIISDLVTESNSVEAPCDQTVVLVARWVTRIVIIFGLDTEGDLSNPDAIGWSGLDIPGEAKPYIYLASQLRDQVLNLARFDSVDHAAIEKLADGIAVAASTPAEKSSQPYEQVLQQFRADVKALVAQQAFSKDLLALCDRLRDVHLWNLGIYLEDRDSSQPALIRPLDKLLVQARAEQEAKLEQGAREAEMERERRERASVDPFVMFRTDEYSEWDERGIPIVDAAGNPVSKNRLKTLVKVWDKQKERHMKWLGTRRAG